MNDSHNFDDWPDDYDDCRDNQPQDHDETVFILGICIILIAAWVMFG